MPSLNNFIARLPEDAFIRALDEREREELLAFSIPRTLRKGEVLFEMGEPGETAAFLVEGTLKTVVYTAGGKEIVLDYVGQGRMVGEMAFFDGGPRSATVQAVTPCEVLIFRRRDVIPWLERNGHVAVKALKSVTMRVRHTNQLLEGNISLAMGPKLASGLLRLIDSHGEQASGGVSLSFKISQSDLGAYVNLSRENVNRQLHSWADAGLIRLEGGRIAVLDREALEEIAEGAG